MLPQCIKLLTELKYAERNVRESHVAALRACLEGVVFMTQIKAGFLVSGTVAAPSNLPDRRWRLVGALLAWRCWYGNGHPTWRSDDRYPHLSWYRRGGRGADLLRPRPFWWRRALLRYPRHYPAPAMAAPHIEGYTIPDGQSG